MKTEGEKVRRWFEGMESIEGNGKIISWMILLMAILAYIPVEIWRSPINVCCVIRSHRPMRSPDHMIPCHYNIYFLLDISVI